MQWTIDEMFGRWFEQKYYDEENAVKALRRYISEQNHLDITNFTFYCRADGKSNSAIAECRSPDKKPLMFHIYVEGNKNANL